jgi:nucleotide-binding universal stress UspA family protein
VLEGSPAAAIAAFAGDRRADIIVLGTHARSGLARGILGSVAAEVVQSSRIAVLVVRAETVFGDTGPLVIAVDGSQASTAAARFALSIAAALAVPVHVVHVADFLDDMHGSSALGIVADQAAAAGVACTTEIRHGRVVENLIAAVTEQGASVLVTGTHGRGAFGRLFLGSVAEGLARAATVPVLIVKSAD